MRLILSTAFLLFSLFTFGQSSKRLIIEVGKLYDSEQKKFLTNQKILIEKGRIKDIGSHIEKKPSTEYLDLSQCTATPGLVDMHTHLLLHQKQTGDGMVIASKVSADERIKQGLGFARENLASGLTTVRDLGNSGQYLDVALKKTTGKK